MALLMPRHTQLPDVVQPIGSENAETKHQKRAQLKTGLFDFYWLGSLQKRIATPARISDVFKSQLALFFSMSPKSE